MIWRDLKTDPPTGDEYAVLLFPCRSDCGVLYTVSNSVYAKGSYALSVGYTHWCEFKLAPNHEALVEWQENLTSEEIIDSLRSIDWNFE
jgi:hypothetical protein